METNQLDPTVMLIWRLANREAALSACREIQPIHFYLAILTAINGINPFGSDMDPAEESAWDEIQHQIPEALSILDKDDAAIITERRALIRVLHSENSIKADEQLVRSASVIELFNQAITRVKDKQPHHVSFLDLLRVFKNLTIPEELTRVKELKKQAAEVVVPDGANSSPPSKTLKGEETSIISTMGKDLTQMAFDGALPSYVIREPETKALARILLKTKKGNALLIGQSGVGKTAIVEGLAQWLITDLAPEELRNIHIIQINAIDLFSNTTYRGQLEQRMIDLLDQLKGNSSIVLFIDEFHIITTQVSSQKFQTLSDILQTALDDGRIRCIGVTTIDEYERYLQPDKAFMRRFEIVTIMEPDAEVATTICQAHARKLSEDKDVCIPEEVVQQAVELSNRYLPGRYQPDKSIDLIENAVANHLLEHPDAQNKAIGVNDLWRVLADPYGVNQRKIDKSSPSYTDLDVSLAYLPDARTKIVDFMDTLSARPGNSGCHALLLCGSSEVGLPNLAKSLGDCISGGSAESICVLDLREFLDPQGVLRLFGDINGGDSGANGILEKQIRSYPNSVYILEHYEIARPVVQQRITQLIEDGSIRNSSGDVSYFQNSVFVLLYETERETLTRRGKKKLTEDEKKEVMEFSLLDMLGQSEQGIFNLVRLVYIFLPDIDDLTMLFDRLFAFLRSDIYQQRKVSLRVGDVDKANILCYLAERTTSVFDFLAIFSKTIYQPVEQYIQNHAAQAIIRLIWQSDEIRVIDQTEEKNG